VLLLHVNNFQQQHSIYEVLYTVSSCVSMLKHAQCTTLLIVKANLSICLSHSATVSQETQLSLTNMRLICANEMVWLTS